MYAAEVRVAKFPSQAGTAGEVIAMTTWAVPVPPLYDDLAFILEKRNACILAVVQGKVNDRFLLVEPFAE
ncbi:hypothetical protein D3C85_897070 [compost metagenome]